MECKRSSKRMSSLPSGAARPHDGRLPLAILRKGRILWRNRSDGGKRLSSPREPWFEAHSESKPLVDSSLLRAGPRKRPIANGNSHERLGFIEAIREWLEQGHDDSTRPHFQQIPCCCKISVRERYCSAMQFKLVKAREVVPHEWETSGGTGVAISGPLGGVKHVVVGEFAERQMRPGDTPNEAGLNAK